MGYFTEVELTTLKLPSNETYWVKVTSGGLRYGDIKKFLVSKDGKVDAVSSADLYLETAIKDWNLDDGEGNVLPITKENIDRLEQDDALLIIKEIGGVVEDDHAKKNS